ncbi:MAG TPA: tRNA-dihydrouridine synthase [Nocardioidaceae bacterium]|nr:tRNA-dihydrouridine synthase [Nocardioidaceae bacterium]
MTGAPLSTSLAGWELPSPLMVASGCAGSGRELAAWCDLSALGALVTRSVTLDPRAGHAPPRVVESPSGVLHSNGLQNPGLQGFLATELPWLVQQRVRTAVSIAGATLGEYAELGRRVAQAPGVAAVEVNLGCADREHHDREFGADPYLTGKVVAAVRREVPRGVTVLAKLRIGDGPLGDLARAAVDAGAEVLVVGNPPHGLSFDPALRPLLGAVTGYVSGPAVQPMALHALWQLHRALPDVPLVGGGGVRRGADVVAMLAAGASAVQIGTALLTDPDAPGRIATELVDELDRLGGSGPARVPDLVGAAHRREGDSQ